MAEKKDPTSTPAPTTVIRTPGPPLVPADPEKQAETKKRIAEKHAATGHDDKVPGKV